MSQPPDKLFQQFFETGPPAVIMKPDAPNFTVSSANPAYIQLISSISGFVYGKSIWELYNEQANEIIFKNRDKLESCFNSVLQTKQQQMLEGLYGDMVSNHYWQVNVSPLLDEEGAITAIACLFNNCTGVPPDHFRLQSITELSEYKKEQLQLQFMRAPVGMVFVNRDNYIIDYANDAMRKLWNKAEGVHILGESVFKIIPELEGQGFRRIFDEVIDTGNPFSVIETPMYYNRGEKLKLYHLDLTVEPLYDAAGEISGLVGFALDVTGKVRSRVKLQDIIDEKKIVEANLRNNEERLVQILETMAEGVGIIDADGMLTYANPMAQQILGLHTNELFTRAFGNSKWENLKPDGSPLPYEEHPMNIMMATGKPVYDQEIAIQPPGGELFYISINAAPIRDHDNRIVAGIGTLPMLPAAAALPSKRTNL